MAICLYATEKLQMLLELCRPKTWAKRRTWLQTNLQEPQVTLCFLPGSLWLAQNSSLKTPISTLTDFYGHAGSDPAKKFHPFQPYNQSTESLWKKCPKIGPQLSRSKITNVHKFNFHSQGSGLTRTNLLPIEDLTCWSSWFHHWWQQRGAASTLGPQWWIDYCWAYGPYRIQLTEKNRSF